VAKKSLADLYRKPAHETEEGKKHLDAYCLALGRFVHRFALAELAIHFVIWNYAKLHRDIGRSILSGARINDASQYLRRLHEVGRISESEWKSLDPILQQLSLITKCRNEILHHGGHKIAEGQGVVTNATVALTESRITSFPISDAILNDMYGDLRKILLRLHVWHMGRPKLRGEHPEMQDGLYGPWRYTQPPTPVTKPRKSGSSDHAKGKARGAPPQPSSE
jgi:hypothetical protein